MPFVDWDDSFITGISEFDEHHRHLVSLLNKTYDDFICAAPDERIAIILDELVGYAGYHFEAEEQWMRRHTYPGYAEHKNEHDAFSKKVLEFQGDYRNGKAYLSLDVLTFLKKWLRNHILVSDAAYGKYKPIADETRL